MVKNKFEKWQNRREVKNGEVVLLIVFSMLAGFTWAYLHWGKGMPWI